MINYSEFEHTPPHYHPLQLFTPDILHEFNYHPLPHDHSHPCAPEDHPPPSPAPSRSLPDPAFPHHSLLDPSPSPSHSPLHPAESSQEGREERRLKNETKNIPKNFGKGIISFMEKNEKKMRALLVQYKLPYHSFKNSMRHQKKTINTIADLRRLWTTEPYCKCMRIISNLFFRRHALSYIFNSRISNYSSHVKYRQSLWQALKDPHRFTHIKQY